MDPKTKELVEAVEHRATCAIAGCARCFHNGVSTLNVVAATNALCAIVREQDKQLEDERASWASLVSAYSLWMREPAKWRPYLDAAVKAIEEHGVPPHIIPALPVDRPTSP